jgi:Rrf2 family protein
MKITAQEEYGLRCLLQLARHNGPEPLTIAAIAEVEGLSVPYVGKLMNTLRHSSLVESVRGRGGGYALTRSPADITLTDALEALGGHFFSTDFCETHHGNTSVCVHLDGCSIRSVWGVLGEIFDRVLRRTTLADLIQADQPCDAVRLSATELAEIVGLAPGLARTGRPYARASVPLTLSRKSL